MTNIIIPVFNALNELQDCLTSIFNNTDTNTNRVVLIDDCSSDSNVEPFLRDLQAKFPQVEVLRNESNIGFAATCNRGITETDGDVILLNSDTLVTPHWVEKLSIAANSAPLCATVTPLSNNATICSVPTFNDNNELPANLSVDQLSILIEIANSGVYRRIPTGVGFCLYIKREVISRIGLFDDITFRDGYGEENDFCFRARVAGYHNLLACDTYVFHKGASSFLGSSVYLSELNGKKLIKKYEGFEYERSLYSNENPNDDIWNSVEKIYTIFNFDFNKDFVLYISHGDPFSDRTIFRGGTEFHIQELSDAIQNDYNIITIFKHQANYNVFVVKTLIEGKTEEFHFRTPEWLTDGDSHSVWMKSTLNALLDAFPISFVHIQHWLGLTLDVFSIPVERNIPFFVTLHDYYCICHVYDFIPDGKTYCGFPESADRDNLCRDCCENHKIRDYKALKQYREQLAKYLPLAVYVYVPTKSAADIIKSVFVLNNLKVLSHGLDDAILPFNKWRTWGKAPYKVAMITSI